MKFYTVNEGALYFVTTNSLLIVEDTKTNVEENTYVRVVAHTQNFVNDAYWIDSAYMVETTVEDYLNKYPNAHKREDLMELKELPDFCPEFTLGNKEVAEENKESEEKTMELNVLRAGRTREDADEIIFNQLKAIIEGCEIYNGYSEDALHKIVKTWKENNKENIEMLEKHPNYNGFYQVVLRDSEYDDSVKTRVISRFISNIISYISDNWDLVSPEIVKPYSRKEYNIMLDKLRDLKSYMSGLRQFGYPHPREKEIIEDFDRISKLYDVASSSYETGYVNYGIYGFFEEGTKEKVCAIKKALSVFSYIYERNISAEKAKELNDILPELKVHANQKTSRTLNMLITKFVPELKTKFSDFEREFAKYGDAINPLQIKGTTVLSCNLIDYVTQSFGTSWRSCHNIDKDRILYSQPGQYSDGCHASGTISYALDETSLVFYVLNRKTTIFGNEADETELALVPKLFRNMFHVGEDKIIQGRLYPQDCDDDGEGLYAQFRNVVQKIVADCKEIPNSWVLRKGTSSCHDAAFSEGTIYPDFFHFSNCNVSLAKKSELNEKRITIGASPICICCGNTHSTEENLICDDCREDYYCEHCGYSIHGEGVWIDDYCYCDRECAEADGYIWCENTDRYVWRDDVYYDEYMERYFEETDYSVHTEDGHNFEDEDSAENYGYVWVEIESGWFSEEEVMECHNCGELILAVNALHSDITDNDYCCEECMNEDENENNEEISA